MSDSVGTGTDLSLLGPCPITGDAICQCGRKDGDPERGPVERIFASEDADGTIKGVSYAFEAASGTSTRSSDGFLLSDGNIDKLSFLGGYDVVQDFTPGEDTLSFDIAELNLPSGVETVSTADDILALVRASATNPRLEAYICGLNGEEDLVFVVRGSDGVAQHSLKLIGVADAVGVQSLIRAGAIVEEHSDHERDDGEDGTDHHIHNSSGLVIENDNAFLMAMGEGSRIEIHAADASKESWTLLSQNAYAGDTVIHFTEDTGWEVGDKIAIAPSGQDYTEDEERTVLRISSDGQTVTLDRPLEYDHYGELETYREGDHRWQVDMRAEVALLSRNITIQGDADSVVDGYGAHTMVMHGAEQHISGAEFYRVGQEDILGKYPIHWHMLGDASGQYVSNVSVHQSYQKGSTIHGTSNALYEDNVIYDHVGHGLFMEDGSETGNIIRGNLVFGTHASKTGMPIPTDLTDVASYWIENVSNTFVDNHAAGSENFGFFIAPATVAGPHGASQGMRVSNNADDFYFVGNTASSSEFGIFLDGHIDGQTLQHVDGQNFTLDGSLWFVDTTAYANREVGLWSFKGNASDNYVIVSEAKLSDNASNLEVRGDDFLFIDSVSIGESDNIATDTNVASIGVKTYRNSDAAMIDVHFANFENHHEDIAISLQEGELKNYGDNFLNITFDDVDNELVFRDTTALLRPDDAFNTVARDDGSLTDVPGGAWITRNLPGEPQRAGYESYIDRDLDNAWITTEGAMGVTEFYLSGTQASRDKVITVTRSVDSLQFEQDLWMSRDTGGGQDLYQFITPTSDTQEAAFLVELGGPNNVLPTSFDLSLDGIRVGEAVVYEIPNVADFSASFGVNEVRSMSDLFAANSTSALVQGGSLFIRVVGVRANDETYLGTSPDDQIFGEFMGTESPGGYAISFSLTPLSQNNASFQDYGEARFNPNLLSALNRTDGFKQNTSVNSELILPEAPVPHEIHDSTSDTVVVMGDVPAMQNAGDPSLPPFMPPPATSVPSNVIRGTDGDDTVPGSQGDDALYGNNGDDLLRGNDGDDAAFGGLGDDNLQGGSGDDTLNAGAGDDYLAGSYGDDIVSGGAGDDEVYGDYGEDVLYGDAGRDKVGGGEGDDTLFGGDGDDDLIGGIGEHSGDDVLVGGAGADNLNGGDGADVYFFSSARDSTANGRDTIQQFSTTDDKIDVSALGITSIDELTITRAGNQTIVSHNQSQFEVLVQGQQTLRASNFVFAGDDATDEVTNGMLRWSNSAAWDGDVPGRNDIVVIGHGQTVVLDASTTVKGIIIAGGNLLVEDAAANAPEIKLISDYVLVIEGGLFQAGTERNPLDREFTLELTGDDPNMDLDVGRILDGAVANTVFADADWDGAPGSGGNEPIDVPVLPVDPTTPVDPPPPIDPTPIEEPEPETGMVSGRLFFDADEDGAFDAGEDEGLNQVQVVLLRDGERVAAAETNEFGIVRFEDVEAGEGYSLRFDDAGLGDRIFAPTDAQSIGSEGRLNTDEFAVTADDEVWRRARVHEEDVEPENQAPVAQSDAVSLAYGGRALVDVLANDEDPDDDALTITEVVAPDGLRAQIAGDNVRVIAEEGFSGEAVVRYTVSDVHGETDTARIVVDVANPPEPEPETGVVSGFIFVDADKDDLFSEADGGLGGIQVVLLRDGERLASAETNGFGVVHFEDIEAGEGYHLRFDDEDLGDGTFAPRDWQIIGGQGRLNTEVFEVAAGEEVWRTARVLEDDEAPENQRPVAADDVVSQAPGGLAVVDVLANENDPEGDAVRMTEGDASEGLRAQIRGDTVRVIAEDGSGGEAVISGSASVGRRDVETEEAAVSIEEAHAVMEGRLSIRSSRNDPSPQHFENGATIDMEAFSADGAVTFALLKAEDAPEIGSVSLDYNGRTYIDNTETYSFSTRVLNYFGPDGISEGEHEISVMVHSEQRGGGEVIDAFTFQFEVA